MNGANPNSFRKSTFLAGFLSMMPGAGQIYVGYYATGFTYILVVAALVSILEAGLGDAEPFFGLFLAFFWIFNIVDAVRKANLYNLGLTGVDTKVEPQPTDSPLVGGVILVILGVLLTLEVTLNVRLDWLENVWPLAILAAGLYLIWKYRRAREELRREGRGLLDPAAPPVPRPPVPRDVPPPMGGPNSTPMTSSSVVAHVPKPGEPAPRAPEERSADDTAGSMNEKS